MFENNLIAGVSGQGGGYSINDSLRFNDNDSAYLSRTPSVAGNRKTWTWSGWVKRGNVGISAYLLDADIDGSAATLIRFVDNDKLRLYTYDGSSSQYFDTTALFRDVSGWYHIVGVHDTTQSGADKLKLYVNGIRQAGSTTGSVADNSDGYVNSTIQHNLGRFIYVDGEYLDGYMAEVNFIDGQALTPDDFGEISETTGEWSPKRYAGTYGTNGFYLPFDGNANDSSGNGNNWTENNLASTDYMIDTPSNSFATLNSTATLAALSEGNLQAAGSVFSQWQTAISGIGVSSGKWYFEAFVKASTPPEDLFIGITQNSSQGLSASYLGSTANSWGYFIETGRKFNNSVGSDYGDRYATGDIVALALDMDAGTVTFYKNNVSQGVAYTGLTGTMFLGVSVYNNPDVTVMVANYGADSSFAGNKTRQGNTDANGKGDFYYAPPAGGYLALCTENLPAPTIEQPDTQFNVVTYTGDGTDDKAITGVGFQPDFVWIKGRSVAYNHLVFDSVRGVQKALHTNLTNATSTYTNALSSFDADGFTYGADGTGNQSGASYVAWCLKAGGTAVTNTDGSITSQVSANVDAGFSVATFTSPATSSTAFTIGHGLSDAPEMIITKERDGTLGWLVYHDKLPTPKDNYLLLNATDANSGTVADCWGTALPTSSVFGMKTTVSVNTSKSVVAYCFHSVEGFSKFGSYVGNGSANGSFVYTGFKPAFVMIKRTDSTSDWVITDNKRDPENDVDKRLFPNLSLAESSTANLFDYTANGFKIRRTDGFCNASGGTYIYMAFAEHPFNYSTGR